MHLSTLGVGALALWQIIPHPAHKDLSQTPCVLYVCTLCTVTRWCCYRLNPNHEYSDVTQNLSVIEPA